MMSIDCTTTADGDIGREVFAPKDLFVWNCFENRSAQSIFIPAALT
jgi:hypothetical protein